MTIAECPPILSLTKVQTRFGKKIVHSDVSFSINQPGVHAIIGESGCGKSVLLREIIGLMRPSGGTIDLLGKRIWELSEDELIELRGRYSVLFQDSALFSSLSVAGNVAAPLKERLHLDPKLLDQLIDLKLHLAGLEAKHRDKMPSELSGGMRKRVALARALALDPDVIFLDEPTSGLDPITSRMFDKVIRTLVDGLSLTVLIITHDVDTILSIVDNLIVLGNGQVLAQGPVADVCRLENPWIRRYFSSRGAVDGHTNNTYR
jgi:phospholipid/cholesterol/gamma-HCH transport system ATP-binding protein